MLTDRIIGRVGADILAKRIFNSGQPGDSAALFRLDKLSSNQIAAVARAILANPDLLARVDLMIPEALVDGQGLPPEILISHNAGYVRNNATTAKAAILTANGNEHNLQAHELSQTAIVDARGGGQGLCNSRIDVEVAAFEHRPRADVALVEDDFQLGKLFERRIELFARLVIEERTDHCCVGCQARAIAEHIDDRDVLDQQNEKGIACLGLGSLYGLDSL